MKERGLRPCALSSVYLYLFAFVLVHLMLRKSCWREFEAIVSEIPRRQSHSKLSVLRSLTVFPPFLPQ